MVLIETTCCIRRQQGKGHSDDALMHMVSESVVSCSVDYATDELIGKTIRQ